MWGGLTYANRRQLRDDSRREIPGDRGSDCALIASSLLDGRCPRCAAATVLADRTGRLCVVCEVTAAKLADGRCSRCAGHRHRHGTDRTAESIAADDRYRVGITARG